MRIVEKPNDKKKLCGWTKDMPSNKAEVCAIPTHPIPKLLVFEEDVTAKSNSPIFVKADPNLVFKEFTIPKTLVSGII